LVHTILEHFNKSIISGLSRNDAILNGFKAGKEYITGYSDYNKFVLDKEHHGLENTPEENEKSRTGWRFVIKTMEEYFDYYRNDSFPVIAAEEVRGEEIYRDDEMRIIWKAKFDVIIDTPHGFMSKDYKTMKQRRETISLNNQFMGQCVLTKSRQVIIDKIGFQTSLKPEEKFTRSMIPYSVDRLTEWTQEVVPHYARMLVAFNEAGYFPPNFTHCENKYGFCNFREICETDRLMREEALAINFNEIRKWDITNDE
jgi:hypothetical protein